MAAATSRQAVTERPASGPAMAAPAAIPAIFKLTALFAVRHREAPDHMRGQIYTTAASLKIAGMAAGAAIAGPLAGRSVTACLLVAAATELCAAAAYLLAGAPWAGRAPRAGTQAVP